MEFSRSLHSRFLLSLLLLLSVGDLISAAKRSSDRGSDSDVFVLKKSKQVYKTEAGELRAVRGFHSKGSNKALQIGFIAMEPKSLFIPQYINANLILFVRQGEMKVGWVCKDEQVEKELKTGDVYRIPSGSTFYVINTSKSRRLKIISSFDTTDSANTDMIQSFFIGGGSNPQSVLAGFNPKILSSSFNVSEEQLSFLSSGRPAKGPIVYIRGKDSQKLWDSIMKQKQNAEKEMEWFDQGENYDKDEGNDDDDKDGEHILVWAWRKLLQVLAGHPETAMERGRPVRSPETYNLYESKPDYQNDYGWCTAVDESLYEPLKHSDMSIYLVNLTAGSMMAPHINPMATEYGVVLKGSGTIHIVFPNGTAAASSPVKEGDVFWVPRYFPFAQVASHSEPMEFFGFTTCSRPNQPHFLAGADSLFATLSGPEFAVALGIHESDLEELTKAQSESVILPTWTNHATDSANTDF